MIAPFLATLNIALHASKSQAGGIAYLALTVRNVDLLNTFIFALGERWRFFYSSVTQRFHISKLQPVSRRTTNHQS
jgi:hypothetical protein